MSDYDTTCCREMPKYVCHKEVHALKIASAERGKDGCWTIQPADSQYAAIKMDLEWSNRFKGGEDPGYYVVYKDGYKSWSPTKAFEEGYTAT